jgi:hypothetical protein
MLLVICVKKKVLFNKKYIWALHADCSCLIKMLPVICKKKRMVTLNIIWRYKICFEVACLPLESCLSAAGCMQMNVYHDVLVSVAIGFVLGLERSIVVLSHV